MFDIGSLGVHGNGTRYSDNDCAHACSVVCKFTRNVLMVTTPVPQARTAVTCVLKAPTACLSSPAIPLSTPRPALQGTTALKVRGGNGAVCFSEIIAVMSVSALK